MFFIPRLLLITTRDESQMSSFHTRFFLNSFVLASCVINNVCVYTWIIYSRSLVTGELSSRMAVLQRTSGQFEFLWVTAV